MPACMETYPTNIYIPTFMESLNEKEFVTFCNALYFEIMSKQQALKDAGFAKDRDFQYLEEYVPAVGDKLIAGEEAKTERLLITSTVFLMMSSMRNSLYDELYQIKDTETEENKLAMELDGYVRKLIWRNWDTNYLEELVEQIESKQ